MMWGIRTRRCKYVFKPRFLCGATTNIRCPKCGFVGCDHANYEKTTRSRACTIYLSSMKSCVIWSTRTCRGGILGRLAEKVFDIVTMQIVSVHVKAIFCRLCALSVRLIPFMVHRITLQDIKLKKLKSEMYLEDANGSESTLSEAEKRV